MRDMNNGANHLEGVVPPLRPLVAERAENVGARCHVLPSTVGTAALSPFVSEYLKLLSQRAPELRHKRKVTIGVRQFR